MSPVVPITDDPLNAETPIESLRSTMVPNDAFYVRCNFPIPTLDAAAWQLEVAGAVARPVRLSLDEVQALPPIARTVTLECAGNGRTLMSPIPAGTPWGLGAIGFARFTGVRLADVLASAGVAPSAVDLVFTGADRGRVEPDGEIPYQFNLPIGDVDATDPILAWDMNGAPLPIEHGAPLRLVVPGHYGMRSVKWLTRIEALDHAFAGHFPRKYRYRGETGIPDDTPVGPIRVRSLVTAPTEGEVIPAGTVSLRGIAWSGHGAITAVDVEIDGQPSAAVLAEPRDGCPTAWRLDLNVAAGRHEATVRATDASGRRQPPRPTWNEGGFGNNVAQRIAFVAR